MHHVGKPEPRLSNTPSRRGALVIAAFSITLLAVDGLTNASAVAEPTRTTFISWKSNVRYHVVRAPLPTLQLGKTAALALDSALDPKKTAVALKAEAPILGHDTATANWLRDGLGADAKQGKTPLAAKKRNGSCKCSTTVGDEKRERIAALYVESNFVVSDPAAIELLELRASYTDGIIVAINGREVARRNVEPRAASMASARRPRGPEAESFFIAKTKDLLVRGTNSLRIEVRPSARSLSPSIDFELHARRGARIVRGPMVRRDKVGLWVAFDTDLPTAALVEFGTTSARGYQVPTSGGELAIHHTAHIPAAPSGPIHYRVVAGQDASKTYAVNPLPTESDVVRFAVYGDMRGGHKVHGAITSALIKEAPDFVVVTGDLVLRGSDGGDWQRFFSVATDLLGQVPYYPAAGNHDLGASGDEGRRMSELFVLPPPPKGRPVWASWYGFDVGGIHFVMLDSNSYKHAEQLEWLKTDLADAKARGVRAIFAATHDGPYSRGIHRGNRYAAKTYAPVLSAHGVTLLFSGHDHLYQRGEVSGLRYIVSGGGGAPLYPVRCGVPGRRRCKVNDGMKKVASEYHYITVKVFKDHARVCAKRPSREALEPCQSFRF